MRRLRSLSAVLGLVAAYSAADAADDAKARSEKCRAASGRLQPLLQRYSGKATCTQDSECAALEPRLGCADGSKIVQCAVGLRAADVDAYESERVAAEADFCSLKCGMSATPSCATSPTNPRCVSGICRIEGED